MFCPRHLRLRVACPKPSRVRHSTYRATHPAMSDSPVHTRRDTPSRPHLAIDQGECPVHLPSTTVPQTRRTNRLRLGNRVKAGRQIVRAVHTIRICVHYTLNRTFEGNRNIGQANFGRITFSIVVHIDIDSPGYIGRARGTELVVAKIELRQPVGIGYPTRALIGRNPFAICPQVAGIPRRPQDDAFGQLSPVRSTSQPTDSWHVDADMAKCTPTVSPMLVGGHVCRRWMDFWQKD